MASSSSNGAGDSEKMESFQSILKSLNIPDPRQDNAQITPEMMKQLSERIMSILGDDKGAGPSSTAITEDGLPVVEITEPEDESLPVDDPAPTNDAGELIVDDFVRHDQLSPDERARRIASVNSLLDELEAEEEEEMARERAEARIWAEQKKVESAERAASMFKAPNAAPAPPRTAKGGLFSPAGKSAATPDMPSSAPTPVPVPEKKKSVRFTSESDAEDDEPETATGDLVFARLKKQVPSTTAARATLERVANTTPMKLDVVERAPGQPKVDAPPPSESSRAAVPRLQHPVHVPDSDDETPPSTPSSSNGSRLGEEEYEEVEAEYQRRRQDVSLDPEELDLSLASRGGIGSGGWDEENVPLDATLASTSRQKPALSRFKASRLAAGESVSVPEIIPSGTTGAALANAIRLGRLKDGELEATVDSDSDEDLEKRHAATFDALKNYGLQLQPSGSRPVPPKADDNASERPQATSRPVGNVSERVPSQPAGSIMEHTGTRQAVGAVGERVASASGPLSAVRERAPPRSVTSPAGSGEPTTGDAPAPSADAATRPKKVSRFKAEKGGQ
ncbi:hypothetical protein EXIGLDRAFT_842348 [Exidia glandulosa HHB12029]|uniref:DUF3835 domain-containing protein n=1 Tax=Exidia glandulosa HHB12029 TaxID=1314781 RepID=A0A165DCW3_EXIGL|nr:hypothetical protein EXIGLDRAFT_842348 [Exidia glandulosa HHB12029]